jgi:hypothetical protein
VKLGKRVHNRPQRYGKSAEILVIPSFIKDKTQKKRILSSIKDKFYQVSDVFHPVVGTHPKL